MSIAVNILPPTVNTLDPVQRARLLRSTRKLGHVLGTTPYVLDSDLLLARPLTPQSLYTCTKHMAVGSSPTESGVSDESGTAIPRSSLETRSGTLVDLPSDEDKYETKRPSRPLVLHLHSVLLLPPMDKYHNTSLAPSTVSQNDPSTLLSLSANTMVKETDVRENEDRLRRKRMAKLSRTLGETIPPELISPRHRKSPSEPKPSSLTRKLLKPQPQTPEDRAIVTHKHVTNTNTKPAPKPVPSNTRAHRPRCHTISSSSAALCLFGSPSGASSQPRSPEEVPFSSVLAPTASTAARMGGGTNDGEWSGEWSIKDAEKRAMVLRNLRSR
ncbi:hypothetical protein AX15_004861 [Amanita polypyramis BW_CC]|nr:hypothetical protein AX15_004861 [Amanita polypyramis BW_CC]